MKIFFIFLFYSAFSFSENLGLSPLDPDYENRLYTIYQKYHKSSMSRDKWLGLIGDKQTYFIQKGDNLWDVSRVLFGDSNYWPKLWSVNADLSNPHRISIGHKLQVIMGSEASAPQTILQTDAEGDQSGVGSQPITDDSALVGISQKSGSSCVKDLALILDKKGITKVYDQKIKCQVVKDELEKRRIKDQAELNKYLTKASDPPRVRPSVYRSYKPVPESLPHINIIPVKGKAEFRGLVKTPQPPSNVVFNYQIDSDDIEKVGKVYKILGGVAVVSSEIILELDVPAQQGEKFSLMRPLKKISPPSFFISGPFGDEAVLQAQVKILSQAGEGLYFAQVEKMYGSVSKQSLAVREAPVMFDFQKDIRSGSAMAQITAVPGDQSSRTLAIHSFVYLNKGRQGNINVGESFSIRGNPRFHGEVQEKALGSVLIVHTSGDFSTGFVTSLKDVSYIGDYIAPLGSSSLQFDESREDSYTEEEDESDFDDEEDEVDFEEEESEEDEDTSDSPQSDFENQEDSSGEEFQAEEESLEDSSEEFQTEEESVEASPEDLQVTEDLEDSTEPDSEKEISTEEESIPEDSTDETEDEEGYDYQDEEEEFDTL